MLSNLAHKKHFFLSETTCRYLVTGLFSTLCLGISACSETADRMPGSAGEQKACTAMALIPAGDFIMGMDDPLAYRDEKPAHTVTLSDFYIDCCEVTNAEYRDFVRATGHKPPRVEAAWAEPYNWIGNDFPPGTELDPVVLVSWHDTTAYAAWAGKRLPTEAEWEKAARAGMVDRAFPYGDTIEAGQANYFFSYMRKRMLRPVGSFEPNAYGLYDMAGNVWEWCRDWYSPDYYRTSPELNPSGPLHGEYKVFRGGSWQSDEEFLRCAQRGKNNPDYKSPVVGFRCVRPAGQSSGSEE